MDEGAGGYWSGGRVDAQVEEDARCAGCGHMLRGLDVDGVCPECGVPVSRSVGIAPLSEAAPEYLARLHRGVVWVITGIILTVLLTLGAVASELALQSSSGSRGWMMLGQEAARFVGMLVLAAGWWMLTTPDEGQRRGWGETARWWVRAVLFVGLGLGLAALGVEAARFIATSGSGARHGGWIGLNRGLGWVWMLVSAGHFVASMLYIQWLGARMFDAYIVRRARLLMWLCPVLTVGCAGLIAMVLYWYLLEWVRAGLLRARGLSPVESVVDPAAAAAYGEGGA